MLFLIAVAMWVVSMFALMVVLWATVRADAREWAREWAGVAEHQRTTDALKKATR